MGKVAEVTLGPRLGALIAEERRRQKVSRRSLARSVGVPARSLRRFEAGRLDAPAIANAALGVLGATAGSLVPERSRPQIDLFSGIIAIDDRVAAVQVPIRNVDDVLVPYLRLVGKLRRGVVSDFRADDIAALVEATGEEAAHIEARLHQLARRTTA